MPSVSRSQHGFAGMSKSPTGRAKLRAEGKTPMPEKVADEYLRADKGRSIKKLPKHVKPKGGRK